MDRRSRRIIRRYHRLQKTYLANFIGAAICHAICEGARTLRDEPAGILMASTLFPQEHRARWLEYGELALEAVETVFTSHMENFQEDMDVTLAKINEMSDDAALFRFFEGGNFDEE